MAMIIYHGNCNDGFCSAYIAQRYLGKGHELVPVSYGQKDRPSVIDKEVYILDFSFKRDILMDMAKEAKSIVLIDHHKTAEADLKDLDIPNVRIIFDMNKSGARLTWEYFHKEEIPHWLVCYTEDRDLWRWKLPYSKEINAALMSYEREIEIWNQIWNMSHISLIPEGEAILRYEKKIIDQAVKHAIETEIDEYTVLSVNSTVLFSEIAEQLAKDRPFGACWFIRADGKQQWSLRSREGGIDVAELAKKFGGGGHKQAAGFEQSVAIVRTDQQLVYDP